MMRYFSCLFIILAAACNPSAENQQDTLMKKATWQHQSMTKELSFRGISVASERVAWVSGNHGTIMVTSDGGTQWQQIHMPGYEQMDFRDIEVLGPDTVLVMSAGSPGVILKTKDGGVHWHEVYFDERPEIFMNSMAFFNHEHGMVVGDPLNGRIFLMQTHDGGETWTPLPDRHRPIPEEGEYLFAASGNCLITWGTSSAAFVTGGSRARVWRTEDAGLHWQPIETPMKSGMPTFGMYAICRTESGCYCVGGDYTDPDNRDRTFSVAPVQCNEWQLPDLPPGGFRSCIKAMWINDQEILIATGMNGTDASSNGGRSWHAIDTLGFHTMDVDPSGSVLFAAGSEGRISKLRF